MGDGGSLWKLNLKCGVGASWVLIFVDLVSCKKKGAKQAGMTIWMGILEV